MPAKEQLNLAYVLASLIVAVLAGLAFQSLLIAFVTIVIGISYCVSSRKIRR
jgi:hypothetical protein